MSRLNKIFFISDRWRQNIFKTLFFIIYVLIDLMEKSDRIIRIKAIIAAQKNFAPKKNEMPLSAKQNSRKYLTNISRRETETAFLFVTPRNFLDKSIWVGGPKKYVVVLLTIKEEEKIKIMFIRGPFILNELYVYFTQ